MSQPQELPNDGPAYVRGIQLPPGRRLPPGLGSPAPVAWATDEPVDDPGGTLRSLRIAGDDDALVPLLLHGIGGDVGERPWDNAEFRASNLTRIDELDASQLLTEWWAMGVADPEEDQEETAELLSPFSRSFPGLAPADEPALADDALNERLGLLPEGRLGLVTATRPADAIAVLGWQGATNYDQAPDQLSAVLRSWEERFGAILVAVGFDTLHLLVERPPQSIESAIRVADRRAAARASTCASAAYSAKSGVDLI